MFKFKKQKNVLADLGPLYHEYSFFGVENEQLEGIYRLNQKSKFPVIMAHIALAIAKCKKTVNEQPAFTELFCADGFYAMVASKLGCGKSIGIDNDRDNHFENARIIAKRLGLKDIEFIKADILPGSKFEETDIVANVGGLYHVSNPKEILELSYKMAKKYLIVQSVVSMASDDPDYFETPAPAWTWGCRFNKISFDKLIKSLNYRVIDYMFNELEGNGRLEDRGSVYYLIEKQH